MYTWKKWQPQRTFMQFTQHLKHATFKEMNQSVNNDETISNWWEPTTRANLVVAPSATFVDGVEGHFFITLSCLSGLCGVGEGWRGGVAFTIGFVGELDGFDRLVEGAWTMLSLVAPVAPDGDGGAAHRDDVLMVGFDGRILFCLAVWFGKMLKWKSQF